MIVENYLPERVDELDPDFLDFELEMMREEDKRRIEELLARGKKDFLPNPYNSCVLYAAGLSGEFDFSKQRADTVGGAPPDIDIDVPKLQRERALAIIAEDWGRDKVANITTHTTMGPRSIIERYFKVTEGNSRDRAALTKLIPPDKFGKAATFKEMVEAHPEIKTKYPDFYEAASTLDGLVSSYGVHAGGVVISDFPIKEAIPTMTTTKFERITQWDMHECEELGLIKWDFLGITTLSILEECLKLIEQTRGERIELASIPDHDEKTYRMLEEALLAGVFQMEASNVVKPYFVAIKPRSIGDIADITSINRPGPRQAGFDDKYIENKQTGYVPDLPEVLKEILAPTHYTLLYQEQVMAIVARLAGFTLVESDDIRRAMGKKKKDVLEGYKKQFIDGCIAHGMTRTSAVDLWDELLGFADYGFNKCLFGSEQIETPTGPVPIERLEAGDIVYVHNNESLTPAPVKELIDSGEREVVEVTFDNGKTVKCTWGHKFLCVDNVFYTLREIVDSGLELKEGVL